MLGSIKKSVVLTGLRKFFRQEVLDLPAYGLDEQDGIKLNRNESPWDLPVHLKAQVVENLLKTPWNRYPLGETLLLKKKMAKYLNVWPDNIVFANGSNVLVQALVLASSVEKKIIITDPTFGVYEIEGRLLGNKICRVPLEDDFSLPAEKFLQAVKKERPGIIFIANPNAPTGNLFDMAVLKKIVETARCLVVIDEAYFPFSKQTALEWVKDHDNLVIMRTFSKAYAMGGVRLGFLVCEPDVAAQIQKCLLPFCVSRLTYATALAVLDRADYVDQYVLSICAERDRVFVEMQKMKTIKPHRSDANFILFGVDDSGDVFKKLLEEKVIVRQVGDGRRLANMLRVTIGAKEENNAFLSALQRVVASGKGC